MASIQGGLPQGLAAIRERFGDAVQFQLFDRRNGLDQTQQKEGWPHVGELFSEGTYDTKQSDDPAPTVTRGLYVGQKAEVDHVVPLTIVWNLGNELANLELLPAALNRGKSAQVGERQLALAKKFHDADLLTDAELAAVQTHFKPAGTEEYQLQEQ